MRIMVPFLRIALVQWEAEHTCVKPSTGLQPTAFGHRMPASDLNNMHTFSVNSESVQVSIPAVPTMVDSQSEQ